MKFCREGKFPASLRDTPLDFAAKKNPAAFYRILKRFSVGEFLASREKFFRVSCSLTAEAGRISRGCLGPSAKRPGSVFFSILFLSEFPTLLFPSCWRPKSIVDFS